MNALPSGVLNFISKITGLPKQHISDYLNGRRNMSKSRAIELEKNTLKLGTIFSRENWMFSPEKIKQALLDNADNFQRSEKHQAA